MNLDVLTAVVKIAALLLALAIAWLTKRALNWLSASAEATDNQMLRELITTFVEAAEQLIGKETDIDGHARYEYVLARLTELGYDITETIKATIESAVFQLNEVTHDGKSK